MKEFRIINEKGKVIPFNVVYLQFGNITEQMFEVRKGILLCVCDFWLKSADE